VGYPEIGHRTQAHHRSRFQEPRTFCFIIKTAAATPPAVHRVAFLPWKQHPEPTGSRRVLLKSVALLKARQGSADLLEKNAAPSFFQHPLGHRGSMSSAQRRRALISAWSVACQGECEWFKRSCLQLRHAEGDANRVANEEAIEPVVHEGSCTLWDFRFHASTANPGSVPRPPLLYLTYRRPWYGLSQL
jgi:hypothetical protein